MQRVDKMPLRHDDELSEQVIDRIAERAAQKALDAFNSRLPEITEAAAERALEKVYSNFYIEVGHSVVSRALWLLGLGMTAAFTYLGAKGYLPPDG